MRSPLLYICGDHDYFQMIPVDGSSPYGMSLLTDGQVSMWADDPHTHIWSVIQGLSHRQRPASDRDGHDRQPLLWHHPSMTSAG